MAECPPGDNLYISGLPLGMDDACLRAIFTPYGTVISTRILPSRPGNVECHALIRFGSEDEAMWIVQNLNGNIPQGLTDKIGAKFAASKGAGGGGGGGCGGGGGGGGGGMYGAMADPAAGARFSPYGASPGAPAVKEEAPPSDNLYCTNLPMGIDGEMLANMFSPFGQVTSSKVLEKEGQRTCCALVRFEGENAATTVKEMCNGQVLPGLTEPIIINYATRPSAPAGAGGFAAGGCAGFVPQVVSPSLSPANMMGGGLGAGMGGGMMGGMMSNQGTQSVEPTPSGDPNGIDVIVKGLEDSQCLPGAQERGTVIYVAGLPGDTHILHVYKLFSSFGAISPKGIAVKKGPANKWSIAFVTYIDSESAEMAIQTYNGMELPDGSTMKVALKN